MSVLCGEDDLVNPAALVVERRTHPRVKADFFLVFQRLPRSRESSPEVGFARDVSSEGVYFYTLGHIEKNDRVSLTVHVNSMWMESGGPPTIAGEGQVIRVEKTTQTFSPRAVSGVAVRMREELAVTF